MGSLGQPPGLADNDQKGAEEQGKSQIFGYFLESADASRGNNPFKWGHQWGANVFPLKKKNRGFFVQRRKRRGRDKNYEGSFIRFQKGVVHDLGIWWFSTREQLWGFEM